MCMKKARKKFEIKDVKNAGSRTKRSGLFHRYFYVTVLILFIGFAILGSSLLIFIARYQSEEKTALLKQNAQTVSQTAAALIQKISENGIDENIFTVIIKKAETNLTVPDLFRWPEYIKELCKNGTIIN